MAIRPAARLCVHFVKSRGSLENVTLQSFAAVTDLLVENGECCGVAALDEMTHNTVIIEARAVLLATGGLGRVFENTTNPDVATGDGVACAYRAGALISDIEFVQFHPTALYLKDAPRFLLSEASARRRRLSAQCQRRTIYAALPSAKGTRAAGCSLAFHRDGIEGQWRRQRVTST